MTPPCRALVGGYGSPGCRDLDFGERFIRLAEDLDWPDGVVVEDLSYSAHLVLHRLQELRPAKVVLVGAVARGLDPPGTVRRYRVDRRSSAPEEVHAHLTESIGGRVGLDNTLSVVGHFGGLPADTVVVEVEPADSSFGLGFSEELAAAIDPLLDIVREELRHMGTQVEPALAAALGSSAAVDLTSSSPGRAPGGAAAVAAPPGIGQLFEYAQAHAQVRALEAQRLPTVAGLAMAARFLPAGSGLGMSGDWYDVLPLAGGVVAPVVADVAGARRVQAATVTAQLKMAVQALALLEGDRPAELVGHLDDLVATTGVGSASTLAYLTVDPADGTVRLASAGHCAPLVLDPRGHASFLETGGSPALGDARGPRCERVVQVERGSTLLLFTDGLVDRPGQAVGDGLRRLRLAAENGPRSVEGLCDHVLQSCVAADGGSRQDDVSLLAVRVLD